MPDGSDEQKWWAKLFPSGDPGVELPGGVWEAAVPVALDPGTAPSDDDLVPSDPVDMALDDEGELNIDHDIGHLPGHDEATHHGDLGGFESDTGHTTVDHYDSSHDELAYQADPDLDNPSEFDGSYGLDEP